MGDLSKNFSRWEFACQCGCGFDTVDAELLDVCQDLADHFGKRVFINSGCRCRRHNKAEGGSDSSQHLYAKAADVRVEDIHPDKVYQYLKTKYPKKYGIGRYTSRTHIDVRSEKARWDNR